MARFNEILTGRHNRFVQKLFGMKGGPPTAQLSSEVSMAHPFFHGAENRYLESWDLFAFAGTAPAVAAQNGGVKLRNPAGSNTIAVIERVYVTSLVADQPILSEGAQTTDLGTIVVPVNPRRDSRGRPASGLILSVGQAASFNSKQQYNSGPTVTCDFIVLEDHMYPLLPGDAIQVVSNQLNQLIIVNFLWRERFLEDSERA